MIKSSIERLNKENNKDNLMQVLNSFLTHMLSNGQLIIPVDIPEDFIDKDMDVKEGETFKLKKDLKLKYRSIRLSDGRNTLVAFTSEDEAHKGEKTSLLTYDTTAFFMNVLNEKALSGVLVNPFADSFFLSKDMIGILLESYRNSKRKSNIYFDIGDITKINCDCIVNAANNTLLGGSGVDSAIHKAAGSELLEECKNLKGCETGQAKITKGYNLKAKYVIHTVGPVYSGTRENKELLESCYINSLNLAKENNIHSIAFPAISTGAYGYPLDEAVPVAVIAVTKWLDNNVDYKMDVIFSCYNQKTFNVYREFIDFCNPDNKPKV